MRSFNRIYPCIQAGPEGSKLIITGDGKLTTEGTSSAGIGISNYIACGDIEIQGGDFTLKDSDVGIGSKAGGSCGNITISGGIITAQGGYVGIGSGDLGSCGNITISDGTITAQGREVGIGSSGYESSCGDITITGGSITAQSREVGIGSGNNGSCGDISISRSENFVSLTAIKGNEVKNAIGATNDNNCGQITFDVFIIKKRNDEILRVENGGSYGNLRFTISTTLPEGVNETDEEAVKPYKDNTWTVVPK